MSLPVLSELRVPDVERHLLHLNEQGKLHMYFYPDRPYFIPEDDEDLIWRAVLWSPEAGPWTWSFISEKLPNVALEARRCLTDSDALHAHVNRWVKFFPGHAENLYESLDELFPGEFGTWRQ